MGRAGKAMFFLVAACFAAVLVGTASLSSPPPLPPPPPPSSGPYAASFVSFTDSNHVAVHSSGDYLDLVLDKLSAGAFGSADYFLYGHLSMQIKLNDGNSAGTVTSFYSSSNNLATHDEFDFEFLGNLTGKPYILQTNIFIDGVGNREHRIQLWFDPGKDFHTYSIFWNKKMILFYVDSVPIRAFLNQEATKNIPFAKKPQKIYASLWDASSWATRGGREPLNWTAAPFIAKYRDFGKLDGCVVSVYNDTSACANPPTPFWWDAANYGQLNQNQVNLLRWVKSTCLLYDYCDDHPRFPNGTPAECNPQPY